MSVIKFFSLQELFSKQWRGLITIRQTLNSEQSKNRLYNIGLMTTATLINSSELFLFVLLKNSVLSVKLELKTHAAQNNITHRLSNFFQTIGGVS